MSLMILIMIMIMMTMIIIIIIIMIMIMIIPTLKGMITSFIDENSYHISSKHPNHNVDNNNVDYWKWYDIPYNRRRALINRCFRQVSFDIFNNLDNDNNNNNNNNSNNNNNNNNDDDT